MSRIQTPTTTTHKKDEANIEIHLTVQNLLNGQPVLCDKRNDGSQHVFIQGLL